MSRAKFLKSAFPLIALAASAACASSPETPALTPEEQAYQDAMAQAMQPATAEEIARAERSDPITRANFWSTEYQKDSANLDVTIKFMRALRQIGSHERVTEIATVAMPIHPTGYELYLELGRSFMAQNKIEEAAQAFVRSADLAPVTDAAPLAALGLAFDRLENHTQAQEAYQIALQREPDRISTLTNYGLSLALTGRLTEAETTLRRAAALPGADARVRQNLALILGLQGRFDEMKSVDPTAPRRSVEANQDALREMIAPTKTYDDLMNIDDVVSDLERTPARAQEMPPIREARIDSDSMDEPNSTPELAGDRKPASPLGLRPTLRGSQGG